MAGPINFLSMAFVTDVASQANLVAVQGAADGSVKLPVGASPAGILGVYRETQPAGTHASVQLDGLEYIAAGGVCTRGAKAAVLTGGTVQNVGTNATPVQQAYVGQFMESGVSGALVLTRIMPGYVTQ